MVVHVQFNHIFTYPFEIVAKSYFSKYTCGKDKNVQAITIEEQTYDPEKDVEIIRRKGKCTNVVPWIFRKLLADPAVYFEETAEYYKRDRRLCLHTRNLSWSSYVRLEETSEFRSSTDDGDWTVFEQHGTIDGFGLGALAPLGERLAKSFLLRGGHKGIVIMDSLIKEVFQKSADTALC